MTARTGVNHLSMDLSRADDGKQQQAVHKDQPVQSTSKATSAATSGRSSRSNSVEGLRIGENEFLNGTAIPNTSSLNSSSFVSSLSNCVSSTLPYVSNGQTAAYNVNQDFLLRMAMQNNQTSANSSLISNPNPNMFHSKIYNDNLAAVAAAVANGNSHSLYQSALSSTSSAGSSTISNSSTISAAHHLAALSPHNSAFQNLQQQTHSHQQLNQGIQSSSNSTVTGPHTNGHSGHTAQNIGTAATGSSILPAEHLLSMTNGTSQSLLAVTNGLINGGNSANLVPNSLSSLSNNGSTNSSTSSTSSLSNNSQMMLNEQLINQNLILASPSSFVPFDPSANNLFSGMKKRKRSPQPIPQDLKDDAYWDRRRRNSKCVLAVYDWLIG